MNKSFTLIEILTVILIVGILSGIIIVATNNVLNSTQDAKRKKDLDSISKALMEYGTMTGSYPIEASDCDIGDGTCLNELIDTGYAKNFPLDPFGARYKYTSDGTIYTIKATLSDTQILTYNSNTGYSQYAGLSGYTRRKSITINSSASLTDYQVKIDVTYDSDMQADFDDLRFTLSNGTTELSHWLESKTDSSTATFWVKIPSLSSGDNTIYMYYGNGLATSNSNGANTFELFDHFEGSSLNTNIWNRTGQAGGDTGYSDSISNSILTMTTTNGSSLWWGVASIQTWSSLTTEALVLFSHDNTTTGGEAWGLQGAGQAIFSKGGSKLYESYNSSWQAETTARADLLTTYQRVRITKNGTTSIKFYYNGTLKDTDVTRIPGDVSALAGKVAKLVSVSGEVKIDWVVVRKYASTEPTVSSWGSEESI